MKCALCVLDHPGKPLAQNDAVTQVSGTLVCETHLVLVSSTPGASQRDPVLRAGMLAARRGEAGRRPRP